MLKNNDNKNNDFWKSYIEHIWLCEIDFHIVIFFFHTLKEDFCTFKSYLILNYYVWFKEWFLDLANYYREINLNVCLEVLLIQSTFK